MKFKFNLCLSKAQFAKRVTYLFLNKCFAYNKTCWEVHRMCMMCPRVLVWLCLMALQTWGTKAGSRRPNAHLRAREPFTLLPFSSRINEKYDRVSHLMLWAAPWLRSVKTTKSCVIRSQTSALCVVDRKVCWQSTFKHLWRQPASIKWVFAW